MKKLLSIILVAIMLTSLFSVDVFAENLYGCKDAFYEKYDLHMSEKAIQSYDIIRMIGEGLNSGISSPLELIDYMKREEGYEGVSGTLAFNEKGCLIPNGNEMLIFENGAFSQINNKE